MAEVIHLHVWMRDKAHRWRDSEVLVKKRVKGKLQMVPHIGKRIVLDVKPGATTTDMKIAVAETLNRYLPQLEYYYVVAVTDRGDGTEGYRTIVRKTVVD